MSRSGLASAPFHVEHLTGRVFFSGIPLVTRDLMPLVELVAREVGNSLDQAHLQERSQQLAIREDRLLVARDLHDGVLQSLTGIRFQLRTLADEPDAAASVRDRALAMERALAIEQRELRLFIGLEAGRADGRRRVCRPDAGRAANPARGRVGDSHRDPRDPRCRCRCRTTPN